MKVWALILRLWVDHKDERWVNERWKGIFKVSASTARNVFEKASIEEIKAERKRNSKTRFSRERQ